MGVQTPFLMKSFDDFWGFSLPLNFKMMRVFANFLCFAEHLQNHFNSTLEMMINFSKQQKLERLNAIIISYIRYCTQINQNRFSKCSQYNIIV